MSYKQMIEASIQGVYEKGIATKILQHMGRIRNASDITQARRWPMELLQNAGDLAYEDRLVRIRVRLTEDELVFEHTGKPFRVRDILSIVNQVSSKNPDEGVGQFGTGFVTTYQLSEKVEIRSVLKEEGLPYKRFSIVLDRSGKTQEELHNAIEKNMRELAAADAGGELSDFDRDAFNTAFVYHLENDHSREVAYTGMKDLRDTILYIMLFSQQIGSVELKFADGLAKGEKSHFAYERGATRPTPGGRIMETIIMESGQPHILRHLSENDVTLAAEYDADKGYRKFSEQTPRLFIDFPLIGAEEFPFPVVIDSRRLQPNEPRSGVSLVDLEQSEDSRRNKAVLEDAVRLYGEFLDEAVEMGSAGIENVLCIPKYRDNKEWSRTWVETNLYGRIYERIAEKEIFDTAEGRKSLKSPNLCLLRAKDPVERKEMIRICADIDGLLTPMGEVDWYAALGNYGRADDRILSLADILKKADEWSRTGRIKGVRALWCQRLYELGMSNDKTAVMIRTGEAAIFPNQCGEDRQLYKATELYRDNGIPEVLKDVSEDLDKLTASQTRTPSAANPVKIRKKLLHSDIRADGLEQMAEYSLTELTEYIAVRSNREFRVNAYADYKDIYDAAWENAWLKMLRCGPDRAMYDLCKRFYKELPDYERLDDARISASLWRNSYKGLFRQIFESLEQNGNLDRLSADLDIRWLNEVYNAALRYYEAYDVRMKSIFPDQTGKFVPLTGLCADRIRAQELKDVAICFGSCEEDCRIQGLLLDGRLLLDDGWCLSGMTDKDVAGRISNAVSRLLAKGNLSDAPEELQDACTLLLAWLKEHPKETDDYFPDFSNEQQQARLVTSKAVVNLQRIAKEYRQLMEIAGTENLEEIEELLVNGLQKTKGLSGGYDDASDVYYGNEFFAMQDDERAETLRKIGRAGEIYAMEQVRKMFTGQGWSVVQEEAGRLLLERGGEAAVLSDSQEDGAAWLGLADGAYNRAELYQPDTDDYCQEGWDIRIRLWRADEEEPKTFYIEVKTHTITSEVKNIFQFSNEQMRLAAASGGAYFAAVMVAYDWNCHGAVGMRWFPNIIKQISEGSIYNATGKHWRLAVA